ncbi:MAG: hypothetical protein ACP5OG_02740 [Candidatus Nanoarchaeia archaeon]
MSEEIEKKLSQNKLPYLFNNIQGSDFNSTRKSLDSIIELLPNKNAKAALLATLAMHYKYISSIRILESVVRAQAVMESIYFARKLEEYK